MRSAGDKTPFIKLRHDLDLTLFLISEELQNQKLFGELFKIGGDDSDYQVRLRKLIFANVGLDDTFDETHKLYCKLIEKHSKKINGDETVLTRQVMKVYTGLIIEKKRREHV
jgi:hypothetical protein